MRRSLVQVTALSVLLAIGACGVKGAPEPPPDADPAEVRDPSRRSAPPPEGTAPAEPFILDRLLL